MATARVAVRPPVLEWARHRGGKDTAAMRKKWLATGFNSGDPNRCDTFAAGLKITRRHRERVWEFLMLCTQSENPWEVRFALVMLMDYYTDEDHLPALFAIYDGIGEKWDHYYVRMALAWAVTRRREPRSLSAICGW